MKITAKVISAKEYRPELVKFSIFINVLVIINGFDNSPTIIPLILLEAPNLFIIALGPLISAKRWWNRIKLSFHLYISPHIVSYMK